MSKSNVFETEFLDLIFNATAIADLAENDTTSPATDLEVALHTADPGEAGTQLTNEATYTGYARKLVARSGAGWVVSGSAVNPAADIDFDPATGGSETITHFSIGVPGSDKILYYGTVSPNIVVSDGVIPRLTTATEITED